MSEKDSAGFSRKIGEKERRKLRGLKNAGRGIWFGFSMFGLVGWSIIIPMVLGALLGNWIDKHYAGRQSWTLTLLILGLVLGSANAWHWVRNEGSEIQDEQDNQAENNSKP